jgi:predicted metal-dependent HD superfamily phosphohydrolase
MDSRQRWLACVEANGLADPGGVVFAELQRRYAERHRAYHNLRHVLDCLDHLEALAVDDANDAVIALAIWFHDAVYSPLEGGNELASADLAVERLGGMGAGEALRRRVHRLIMVTTHDAAPEDLDEAVMIDVDLAILGSEPSAFEVYEANIRREYRWVPGPLFRRKRRAILEGFLAQPTIYHTEPFRRRFEDAARANLAAAIEGLG